MTRCHAVGFLPMLPINPTPSYNHVQCTYWGDNASVRVARRYLSLESIMANAKQVVDTNVLPVNQFVAMLGEYTDDITAVASSVAELYRADSEIESLGVRVADTLYPVLVSQGDLTLGWFDAVRLSFGEAYRAVKTGASDEAVRKAWSRAFGLVTDLYSIEKPKAESTDAVTKSVKRAEESEKVAALIASAPVAELQDRAKALFNKAGDGGKAGKEALAEAKLVTKAIDKATSAEADRLKAQVKELKDSIRDLLKRTDDFSVLADVQELLLGSVNDTEALL